MLDNYSYEMHQINYINCYAFDYECTRSINEITNLTILQEEFHLIRSLAMRIYSRTEAANAINALLVRKTGKLSIQSLQCAELVTVDREVLKSIRDQLVTIPLSNQTHP